MTEVERARFIASLSAQSPPQYRAGAFPSLPSFMIYLTAFVLVAVFWDRIVGLISIALYLGFVVVRGIARLLLLPEQQPTVSSKDASEAIATAETVYVQRVESNEVVEFCGDEVTIYVFRVADERLFWHGVMSYENLDAALWPNSCFEVVQVPQSQEVFGPFCEGNKLVSRATFDHADLGELPESGVIAQSMEGFLRDVTKRV